MIKKQDILSILALIFAIIALVPWATAQFSHAINTDIAYLTLSAERLLDGMTMSEGYYDTNPPLSIIVQIPAVVISKLGIPLYHATNIYGLILLALSFGVSALLLKKIPNLSKSNQTLILISFLVVSTLQTGYDFGQKDHILALGLFPLALLQILITQKIEINKILYWTVLISGSILILIKPHFGLIPAAIFIHRAFAQKRPSVLKDTDFLSLAACALLYVATIFFFFKDFVSIILPDILKYYTSDISPQVIESVAVLMVIAALPLIIRELFLKTEHNLISVFSVLAILCLIPVLLQGKGWAYHMIPANMFLASSYALLISAGIAKVSNEKNLAFMFTTAIIIIFIFQNTTKPSTVKKHEDIKKSQFAKVIGECEQPCSFLVLHDMINMSHELSIYTNRPHASRFPVMWFTPYFINPKNEISQQEERKYSNMIAEDFKRWKPDIVFVMHFPNPFKEGELFNHRDYLLKTDPQFEKIWNNYQLERTVEIDRLEYMERKKPSEDLIRYDIYRKKNPQKENTQ